MKNKDKSTIGALNKKKITYKINKGDKCLKDR